MSTVQIDKAVIERAIEAIDKVSVYGRWGSKDVEQAELQKSSRDLNAALAASQEPAQAVRSDGMPASADERYLRRILAQYSGIEGIYFDDGEASGQSHDIVIDFMRDSVKDLDIKLLQLGRLRFQKELQASQAVEPICKITRYQAILDWNRAQSEPPIAISKEYFVAEQLEQFYPHPAPAKPLSEAQYTEIAHRTASRYTHRTEPQFVAYTFLPHTLDDFVRKIEAAIKETS
jgi:hypothetical protein